MARDFRDSPDSKPAARHHDLKTVQPYFDDVTSGAKTFEVRLNDRAFQAGDTVTLHEFDPDIHEYVGELDPPEGYSGQSLTFRIGYVLSAGPAAPLGEYVVFTLAAEAEPEAGQ